MHGHSSDYVFAFLMGVAMALVTLRFMMPVCIRATGADRARAIGYVIELIERPSLLGFRYSRVGSEFHWIPSGPDIYTWDPSIRIVESEHEVRVIGPACVLNLIYTSLKSRL